MTCVSVSLGDVSKIEMWCFSEVIGGGSESGRGCHNHPRLTTAFWVSITWDQKGLDFFACAESGVFEAQKTSLMGRDQASNYSTTLRQPHDEPLLEAQQRSILDHNLKLSSSVRKGSARIAPLNRVIVVFLRVEVLINVDPLQRRCRRPCSRILSVY